MDLLRINEQEGQFLKNGVWIPICDIERDDLLELIRATASNDHVGLVECKGVSREHGNAVGLPYFRYENDLSVEEGYLDFVVFIV